MASKIIGIIFSLFLVYYSDLLYGKYISNKFKQLLKELEIPSTNRSEIMTFFKAHMDLLAYISSAIAAIITLSLGYEIDLVNFKTSSVGLELNNISMSEINFLARSIAPIFILIVIVKSFLMLPNSQPGKLQKLSIIVSTIVILFEILEVL